MATIVQGEWWELTADADLALFTGNSTVRRDGALVMGRGLAREVRDRFPGIDRELAARIGEARQLQGDDRYGVAIARRPFGMFDALPGDLRARREAGDFDVGRAQIGVFQVKRYWGDAADLGLIGYSIERLNYLIAYMRESHRVVLNYPGIGNGRRSVEEVVPLLERLDVRVVVCYR